MTQHGAQATGMEAGNGDSRPTISVLLAAHNESANIAACLRSVLNCTGPDRFEVVVVDDGSTDDTANVVADIADGSGRVRLVLQDRQGKGAALNRAVRLARGSMCLVTDADCMVPASWVGGMASELHRTDLAYGTIRLWETPADGGWWVKIQEAKQRVKWDPAAPRVFSPVGASMGFKRAVWDDIGGFAETGAGVDRDFGERAMKCGWKASTSLADHARIRTKGAPTYPDFVRQTLRWRNIRALRNLLRGSFPGWEQMATLTYAAGVSLAFFLWTVGCLATGNGAALGLGVAGVVGVDLLAYGKPLVRLATRSGSRAWVPYFMAWILCMVPVRLCETPYLLVRLLKGVEPVWQPVR